ncbi:hypothetical protein DXG01_007476 [Tephrocybe rancida]|nr:hypothetical protein DXG01_007476 [Tephrocybe rancida]
MIGLKEIFTYLVILQSVVNVVRTNPARFDTLKKLYETDIPGEYCFQPQVLSLAFRPFRTPPPTQGKAPLPKDHLAVKLGGSATEVLRHILYHTEGGKAPLGFTVATFASSYILSAWPEIFEWMKFLHYFAGSDAVFDPSARSLSYMPVFQGILTSIILSLEDFNPTPTCIAICRTRGVLQMALEIWVRQQELSVVDWRFGETVKALVSFAGSPDVEELNRSGFGLGMSRLASMLMRPIRFVTYGGHTDPGLQGYSVTMQACLAFVEPTPTLFKALVADGLMIDVVHGISSALSLPNNPEPLAATGIEGAFLVLHMILFSMDANKKCIHAALRLQMIPLIVRFDMMTRASGTPANILASFTRKALGGIFMPYVFHPSILPSLARVMKSLPKELPDYRGISRDIITLNEQWKSFYVIVENVSRQQDEFQALGGFRLKCSLVGVRD